MLTFKVGGYSSIGTLLILTLYNKLSYELSFA